MSTCRRARLDLELLLWTKINSKWTKDLDVSSEILKLLLENLRKTFPSRYACKQPFPE
jgi:hypothetical protein